MKRMISMAGMALFAASMATPVQALGFLGGSSSVGGASFTFANDILHGRDKAITGFSTRVTSDSAGRLVPMADPYAARDGCINYPGKAHNSADCSLLTAWDSSWVLPTKPISQLSGAEENMLRNYRLLTGKLPPNE